MSDSKEQDSSKETSNRPCVLTVDMMRKLEASRLGIPESEVVLKLAVPRKSKEGQTNEENKADTSFHPRVQEIIDQIKQNLSPSREQKTAKK